MKHYIYTPLNGQDIESLNVGDIVYLTGTIVTARDQAYKRIVVDSKPPPLDMNGMAVFHAGPVVKKYNGEYKIISIGPTTSTRMEPYESSFIKKTGIKMIIGKGVIGQNTAKACSKYKAIVALFPGGCGALGAKSIRKVVGVYWLELGIPEALWVLEVENMGPLIIVVDSRGKSLFEEYSMNERKISSIINKTLNDIDNVLPSYNSNLQ